MLPRAAKQSLAVSPAHSFDSTTLTEAEIRRLAARFGSPLLVVDCEQVRRQYRALRGALPGVDLHYALKPLPHASVVATLRDEGAFFDLATTGEVELVKAQGIAPERCIHTHPIKRDSDIRDALRFGVTTFVVDNPDEIRKFVRYRKRAELLLRVCFRSPTAVCDLSKKFGCEPGAVLGLIELARRLGVRVRGLSFHVGSQATDPSKYIEAIHACTNLIAEALLAGLPSLDVLDIGGGFPVAYTDGVMPIEEFCAPDSRGAGKAAEARARDCRAGAVHRRARRDRGQHRDGQGQARRALVVLPGRRPVRLVQRPVVRPREVPGHRPA